MSLMRELDRRIAYASARALRIVRRGILRLATATGLQVEYFDGDVASVEHWGAWGVASRPPAGADVLVAVVAGAGEQAIAFAAADRAHKPSLSAEGDAVVYGSKSGSDQSTITIGAAGGDVDLVSTAGTVNVAGDDEAMLLGETTKSALLTFATACKASTDGTLAAAATALETAINAGWLSTKAKLG